MRYLTILLLAAACKRASNAPLRLEGVVSVKDTLRDTLVFTAKLYDTVRLQSTQLITRFDTQTQTLRITQLLSVPVVRDTVKQLIVLPQVQQHPTEQPVQKKKRGFWGWVDLIVTIFLVLLSLLLLYVVLRTFVF